MRTLRPRPDPYTSDRCHSIPTKLRSTVHVMNRPSARQGSRPHPGRRRVDWRTGPSITHRRTRSGAVLHPRPPEGPARPRRRRGRPRAPLKTSRVSKAPAPRRRRRERSRHRSGPPQHRPSPRTHRGPLGISDPAGTGSKIKKKPPSAIILGNDLGRPSQSTNGPRRRSRSRVVEHDHVELSDT